VGLCAYRYFHFGIGYSIVSASIGAAAAAAAVWVQGTALAFATNPVADWLQSHPRGQEILREFAR